MEKVITRPSSEPTSLGTVLEGIDLQSKQKRIITSSGMSKPRVLILTGLGINSQAELGWWYREAGADVDFMLFKDFVEKPEVLDQYQGLGLAGGFAMGDQLGAGQSLANRILYSESDARLRTALDDPNFPVYAVCNSLQLLAKRDMMPFKVGTVQNDSGKHETTSWDLALSPSEDTVWFADMADYKGPVMAPISHGEGRIIIPNLQEVIEQGYVAMRFTEGHMFDFYGIARSNSDNPKGIKNPNGSPEGVTGFEWNANLVLFPHLERIRYNCQREDKDCVPKKFWDEPYEPTRRIFTSAVDHMKN